jgi:hypothetical protein
MLVCCRESKQLHLAECRYVITGTTVLFAINMDVYILLNNDNGTPHNR